ncbi:MAG TPA: hypothetical protein DF296_07765 [Candidatus Margulisbacteria bacterium]|nr:MAG: hypothetical protein A2X43_07440 [Candidatus Margulisbacteria bacterium GWD2_39_127]OGI08213.1 MAG: hypothetical protein A2X41_00710 [Candidatus Margulisbacteria bacterium GWE2_39_32]HAR61922.1 hypothetical protein [Candidatus Margulisiibacteriota bacterium]HCT85084.1 hypothetical protein [Candidatus Margulisiibacteriota bacterium]
MQNFFSIFNNHHQTIAKKEIYFLLAYIKANIAKYSLKEIIQKYLTLHAHTSKIFIIELLDHLEQGNSFASFLNRTQSLPAHLSAILLTTEEYGELPSGLGIVLAYNETMKTFKNNLLLTLLYPFIIIIFCIALSLFFLFGFIPMIVSNFVDMDIPVPEVLSYLNKAVHYCTGHFLGFFLFFLICIGLITSLLIHFRTLLLQLFTKVPLIRQGIYLWDRYQFYLNMKIALGNNKELTQVLKNTRTSFISAQAREDLSRIIVKIYDGDLFSQAIQATIFSSPEIQSLILLHEDSESLLAGAIEIEQMIKNRFLYVYDISRRLLEPAIILIIGMFVFIIALLFMQPVNYLMEKIST